MQTFSANDAKQNFGEVIDAALRGPISITKHGRPSVVITSEEDYRELQALVHGQVKAEVGKGIEDLEAGRSKTFSTPEELSGLFSSIKKRVRQTAQKSDKRSK